MPVTVPFLACMATVAAFYHLPPRVLPAIQAVEGGQVGTVHGNRDGSQDLGVMQINTRWIEPLAAWTGTAPVTIRERLVTDACFNIATAGAVMRICLCETGGALLPAVGCYHSHRPDLAQDYQAKVLHSATVLFATADRRR
jgi:hypothetical protein